MAQGIAWGDIRLVEFDRPDKTRPALVLTRTSAISFLGAVTVAPITRTIRGIPTEVRLGTDHGLSRRIPLFVDRSGRDPGLLWNGQVADREENHRDQVLLHRIHAEGEGLEGDGTEQGLGRRVREDAERVQSLTLKAHQGLDNVALGQTTVGQLELPLEGGPVPEPLEDRARHPGVGRPGVDDRIHLSCALTRRIENLEAMPKAAHAWRV